MCGFPGKSMPDTLFTDLHQRGLGGVLIFGYNIDNPGQLTGLTTQMKNVALIPPFIAIDQEGGKVARLNQTNGYQKTPTAQRLGTVLNNLDSTAYYAALMAGWLKNAGINVNFAPVADVNVNPNSPAIGALERSYSASPVIVHNHARTFVQKMTEKKIIPALKHFPGHGSAANDSHLGFTDISSSWSNNELIPYQDFIQQGYQEMIMSGHLFHSDLDSVYPVSLSKNALTNLLRQQMGYTGLIVTDELFMGAISQNFPFDEMLVAAINAGNDILLFNTNIKNGTSLVDSILNIVEQKIQQGHISINRIEESYQRIMQKKAEITSVAEQNPLVASDFRLGNYPNPFNPETKIVITLPESGELHITAYDITGTEVARIFNGYLQNGVHEFSFNGASLPSGTYFIRATGTGKTALLKTVLLK